MGGQGVNFGDVKTLDPRVVRMMRPEDRRALGLPEPAAPGESRPASRADTQAEKELQRICEQALNSRGIAYLHLSPMAREKKGWPDLTFVVKGVPYAIELKSATGKLSEDQERMKADMERNGWRYEVVRAYERFREIIGTEESDHAFAG